MRRCKVCRAEYAPTKPMQSVCGHECAMSLAASKRTKAEKENRIKEKRADKVKKESLKRRADWAREAQASFNTWVRERDADRPCISCGRHHTGQYHAGHYLSVGARPELRFEPLNVWKQCSACNTHLSGNVVLYRVALLKEIGAEKVEWLEGPHDPKHCDIEDLKAIKAKYTALARELKNKS